MRTTVIAGTGMGLERAAAAASLAVCWGERGDRVLAVDGTPEGDLSALVHAPVRPGGGALADVMVRGRGLTEAGCPTGLDGVAIVTGGPALAGLDAVLAGTPGATERLRRAIANMPAAHWDRVVIDVSEAPAVVAAAALVAADEVVVATGVGPQALATVRDAEQAIGRVRARGGNPGLRCAGVVLMELGTPEAVRRTWTLLEGRGTPVLGVVRPGARWADWRLLAMRLAAGAGTVEAVRAAA
jgi:cellulose biosynthesis protein BcsQ